MSGLIPEKWYALHVRYQSENMVSELLRHKGYEEYVPLYEPAARGSGRQRQKAKPLLPGYVFCRQGGNGTGLIVTTPGVIRILGVGNRPQPIGEDELQRIQRITECGLEVEPWAMLEPGDPVMLEEGPLRGCTGVLRRRQGKSWLVVAVTMLQRSVAVTVRNDWIVPAPPRSTVRRLSTPSRHGGTERVIER